MADTRISLRLDLAGDDRVGPGKIALLEAIRDTGSISAAARRMDMSYRRAWLLVEALNTAFRGPLVVTAHGGRAGGGAALTEDGAAVVGAYRAIEAIIRRSADGELRRFDAMTRSAATAVGD